ncbi:uncharacterized protein N7511_011393 [Penicillium nucicola]|uniref:uncharacterized protein n=1 Tax=Penicillium nucicola TaxID=1850975 RepID=UPI002545699C|nr:uncharacterized protein N7511_011393 [Penicillium nucicola]KAJ5742374.1 hypothetical protein N7511_011393 [Penicillium nucicola]
MKLTKLDNANTKEYLDQIRNKVVENLRRTTFAPSTQMKDIPQHLIVGGMEDEADNFLDDLEENENKDTWFPQRQFDKYTERAGELRDSEGEEEKIAKEVQYDKS